VTLLEPRFIMNSDLVGLGVLIHSRRTLPRMANQDRLSGLEASVPWSIAQ
jgi:hypothetical protein